MDARVECDYFANFDGYCQYHYGFMVTYCPKACDLCGRNRSDTVSIGGVITREGGVRKPAGYRYST